jgi:excisionase family DNA binding protein
LDRRPTVTSEPNWRDRATITVEEAGAVLGVGRSAAYAGVRSGDIPAIRVGKRLLCPTAKLKALLGENEGATAPNGDTLLKLGTGAARHGFKQA